MSTPPSGSTELREALLSWAATARDALVHGDFDKARLAIGGLATFGHEVATLDSVPTFAQPLAFTPGKWFQAETVDEMQRFYSSRLPAIRKAAREHGYAIGLHGSMRRDLDLMAVAWRDGASDADTLAHAVAQAACGITRQGVYDWERKPAGRVATSIPICWTAWHGQPGAGHIDLSVLSSARSKHRGGDDDERAG